MGFQAAAAVFYFAGFAINIHEIPAALIAQHVQRTITEHAVEIARIVRGVAREVFAFFIAEKTAVVCVVAGSFFGHDSILRVRTMQ
jgi:hypothetical protein